MNINQKSVILGWFFIITGCALLILAADIIFKLMLIIGGIGFILYGFSLKGSNTRFMMQRFFMKLF